jgi:hypothetical protein
VRKPRGSIGSVPADGQIVLHPGVFVEFHVDRPINPSYGELVEWMRQMRGGVLSASFGIENEMILLALVQKFGTNDHGKAGSDYFGQEQTWREEHSLERKIERIKPIIRERRQKEVADEIIQKLSEYRDLRNLFAHYPYWVEPVNDVPAKRTMGLKVFIADRTHVWEVDVKQAAEWNTLILFVRVSVENLRREMIGAPLLNADGSLPPSDMQETIESGVPFEAKIEHGNVSQIILPAVKQ